MVLAGGLALAGCGGQAASEPREASSTVVDSAGITIVTSAGPERALETAWRISATPIATIGTVDGPPEQQLFDVADAALLSDGSVLIANRGTHELRIFDRSGGFVRAYGGEGEGPGEFRRLTAIDVTPGDSIFAWDQQNRRVSVFSATGGFVRSFPLAEPDGGGYPSYADRFGDGDLLVIAGRIVNDELADFQIIGGESTYLRYGPDGAPGDTLGRYPNARSMIKFLGDSGGIAVTTIPFDPANRPVPIGDGYVAGAGRPFEIRRYDATGALVSIIRRAHQSVPITREMLMSRFEEEYARFEDQADYHGAIREMFEAMPAEEAVAAFNAVLASPGGHLWVRSYPLPGDTEQVWSVFSPEGVWVTDVAVPTGMDVHAVGDGVLVGAVEDELEVEHVVVHEIVRPE